MAFRGAERPLGNIARHVVFSDMSCICFENESEAREVSKEEMDSLDDWQPLNTRN